MNDPLPELRQLVRVLRFAADAIEEKMKPLEAALPTGDVQGIYNRPQPTPAPLPEPTPEPSPGTVRFPVVEIGAYAVPWWECRGGDENSPPRTYGGHTVYQDANGLWINTNTGYRTYLQPSATLDPLP